MIITITTKGGHNSSLIGKVKQPPPVLIYEDHFYSVSLHISILYTKNLAHRLLLPQIKENPITYE